MTMGQKIHLYRKQNGWTLETLGARCGVQKSVVAKWEKDKVNLNAPRIKQLAEIFGVSPADLLDDAEEGARRDIEELIERIRELPPDRVRQVMAFLDALEVIE